ncbi:UNVERIFIED_CONTAM: peptidylprolyl isomerase PrsA [Streptococcus canis]|uniref:peptidylprolyl isomerase PrsA n=1 Tax=Streptococcus canis TaxID=1329 RepID=UPI0013DA91F3|nr:peptidylprolyl isomerase PrsA [Streptococcus canis]QKG75222.1 peptidylprolyl isomerase PrsA [Streptococcus canis]GMX36647.1 peptidylprolyl isomerase PrsA [Streptococcus canis]GMX40465.1 peptidylprolyl isomerase PrsA [Streptococcus canis]
MKKSNRLVAGIVTLASVMTLAACQSTNDNTKVISMKGDTISVSDFYNETKHTEVSQKAMLNLVISRVFEAQYGDKVSNKEVEKAYNKTADQYASSFSAALAQSGLTPESYKGQIRSSKLVEYAVREAAKKELTTEEYKKAYESYTPTMTAEVVTLDSEEKAKSVLEELKAEGADFAAIAKEKTTAAEKKVVYKFDSGATTLPEDVVKAASGLKEGDMSEVISVLDPTTYQSKFYIVKVTKKAEKKANWKVYKKRLKAIILAEKTRDINFQNKIIAKALDKANVKIKDRAFANILAQYANLDKKAKSSSSNSATPKPSEEKPASESTGTSQPQEEQPEATPAEGTTDSQTSESAAQ